MTRTRILPPRTHSSPKRPTRRVLSTVAIAAAVVVGLSGCAVDATVTRVIDGDTIEVTTQGRTERVRLLNIDTPELNGPNGVPECLALEAKQFTADLLPKGSKVHLVGDEKVKDKYGRFLARVENADGANVSEELARVGLGVARTYGDNKRDYQTVLNASREAELAKVGMFDETNDCTPAALVKALEAQTTKAALPADSVGIATHAAAAAALIAAADTLDSDLVDLHWLTPLARGQFQDRVDAVRASAEARKIRADKAYTAALASEEAARAAEAARIAAEEAARQAAEAAARQAAEEAAAQAQRAAERNASNSGSSSTNDSGGPSDGGGSTYTGCRNYNGYGMIDTKGRHFAPIPC